MQRTKEQLLIILSRLLFVYNPTDGRDYVIRPGSRHCVVRTFFLRRVVGFGKACGSSLVPRIISLSWMLPPICMVVVGPPFALHLSKHKQHLGDEKEST